MQSFIYGGDTGETIQSLKRKRDYAQSLMQGNGTPRNAPEAIASVGKAIMGRIAMNRLDKRAAAGRSAGENLIEQLMFRNDAPDPQPPNFQSSPDMQYGAGNPAPQGLWDFNANNAPNQGGAFSTMKKWGFR